MNSQKDIFFYFILKLKEKYNKLNPKITLDRKHILKMLFIASIEDNRILNGLGDNNNFNSFYAMENGAVESNCYNYIYNYGGNFEILINDVNLINENISNEIDYNIKRIINESINKINKFIFLKDSNYLTDYIHTFDSWKNAWEKCKIYQKKAYPISNQGIINDGKY